MPVPETLNARIAIAKGWTWHEEGEPVTYQVGIMWADDVAHWQDSDGKWAISLPDWVGTLKGVAELMRDLNAPTGDDGFQLWYWVWGYDTEGEVYYAERRNWEGDLYREHLSPPDRPGDCVGDAWLSVFGKESEALAEIRRAIEEEATCAC